MTRHRVPEGLADLYRDHVVQQFRRWSEVLQAQGYERLLVCGGELSPAFRDDVAYPYRVNPYFKTWVPIDDRPGCYLLLDLNDERPHLFYHFPEDIWHRVEPLTDPAIQAAFQVHVFADPQVLADRLSCDVPMALVGAAETVAWSQNIDCNPPALLQALDYQRAWKSPYELACMRLASQRAARGHVAARAAFVAGASEFDIHLAYLAASRQLETELPYGNIIAVNGHGAVLHYEQKQRQPPLVQRSLLIDAGAQVAGYAADVTRTYALEETFGELVEAMEQLQQTLIAEVRPGLGFIDLQRRAHQLLAQLLCDQGLVRASAEAVLEQGLTHVFFPHGLGHLLGVQVHDRGGWLQDGGGPELNPPAEHPYLRLTRVLEPGMALTIEPGLYFIDALLEPLMGELRGSLIQWERVEELRGCGGIRIEDNVVLQTGGVENLTRDAFAALAG